MHPHGRIESCLIYGDGRLYGIYDTNTCHLSIVLHELIITAPDHTQWDEPTIPCKPTVFTNGIVSYNRLRFEKQLQRFSQYNRIRNIEMFADVPVACPTASLAACLNITISVCDIFFIVYCPIRCLRECQLNHASTKLSAWAAPVIVFTAL